MFKILKYMWILPFLGELLPSARASLVVDFDCYFAVGLADCRSIRNSFFNSVPGLVQVDSKGTPAVTIKLRSFNGNQNYRYVLEFEGGGDLPSFVLVDQAILKNFSKASAEIALLMDLQKSICVFLSIVSPGNTENGKLTLECQVPNAAPAAVKKQTGWYFSASGTGNFSVATTTSYNLAGSAEINRSNPETRLNIIGSVSYNKLILNLPDGTTDEKEMMSFSGRSIFARTFDKHWSVAVGLVSYSDPRGSNVNFSGQMLLGLEWNLIPILTDNDKTLALRYGVKGNYQTYHKTTINHLTSEAFTSHFAETFLTWHFSKIDLSGGFSISSPINDYNYLSGALNGVGTLRLTDEFSISANSGTVYESKFRNKPRQMQNDAAEQTYTNSNYSNWTFYGGLTLNVVLGDVQSYTQDTRWR